MATDPGFLAFVLEQLDFGARLTHRKMFGEYALYLDGTVFAFVCDNSLFLKPTEALARLAPGLPQRPFYRGGRPHPVADELLDDRERLQALVRDTVALLPPPAPPRPRKPRGRPTAGGAGAA